MSESDDLFIREDPIFVNKELLEINHLPEEGRIVGRDEEIGQLANAVNPGIFGQSPSNVLIYGKTGTGKSLCAKYVSRRLVQTADEEGVSAAHAYVDCAQDGTETQVSTLMRRTSIFRTRELVPPPTTNGCGRSSMPNTTSC
jgi:cell division control protein 6